MKKAFQLVDNCIGYIESLGSMAALAIICIIAFVQVILRYFLGKTIPWSEEVIAGLMVIMAMLGAARGIRIKSHTELEGVPNSLPRLLSIALRVVTTLVTLAFLVLITWSSWVLFSRVSGLKTPYLRISYSVMYASLFIGGGMMVYEFLKVLHKRILGQQKSPTPEREESLV